MDTEIEYLESRVAALIARLYELQERNSQLAETLSQALKENAELRFRLKETHTRVASLIERLPTEEEDV